MPGPSAATPAPPRGCPDPAPPFGLLLRPPRPGGFVGWLRARFPGRGVALSANARGAIRQAVDRLDLAPGDEVLVPAWNCGSEVDPLLAAGLSVRLVPVDRAGRVTAEAVAERIGPRTRALHLIHYFGWPQPEVEAIARLCRERGVALIEDCALALLSTARHGPLGGFGDAAVFSLAKFLPVIGGGALVLREGLEPPRFPRPHPPAREAEAVARALVRRVVGQGRRAALRRRRGGGEAGQAEEMPDIPAGYRFDEAYRDAGPPAVTRRLADRLDPAVEIEARRRNHALLSACLSGVPGLEAPLGAAEPGVTPRSAFLLTPPGRRNAICAALQADGIAATPWWAGFHGSLDWSGPDAAEARTLKARGLSVPIHPGLSEAQIRWMADRLAALAAGATAADAAA